MLSAIHVCLYVYIYTCNLHFFSQVSMDGLHDACDKRNYDKVKELLDGGADINTMLVMPLAVL